MFLFFFVAYKSTYGDNPVWKEYRRNHKGSIPPRKTRKMCIVSCKLKLTLMLFFIHVYYYHLLISRDLIWLQLVIHVQYVVTNTSYSTTEMWICSNSSYLLILENCYPISMYNDFYLDFYPFDIIFLILKVKKWVSGCLSAVQ